MKPYGFDAAHDDAWGERRDSTATGRTPNKSKSDSRRIDKKKTRARLNAELRRLAREDMDE